MNLKLENSFKIENFAILQLEDIISKSDENPNLSIHLGNPLSFYSLLLFEQDTIHTVDSKEFFVKKNECLFVMDNSDQTFRRESDYKGIIVLFTQNFFIKNASIAIGNFICQRRKRLIKRAVIYNYPFIDDIIDFISEYSGIEGSYRDSRVGAIFSMYFLKMFEAGVVDRERDNFWSSSATFIEFNQLVIDNSIGSRDAKDYAKEMGITYGVLNRLCKKYSDMTPKNCIDTISIIEAQRLLLPGDLSVKEVASELGFDEPSNFSKFFKKRTGILPIKFRDSMYQDDI